MHIVIEGQDATGKDTQAELLKKYFEAQGKKVVTYSESGNGSDDPLVQTVAKANLNKDFDISAKSHAMLYLINRYELWRKLAEPALKDGDIVITTRNWLSTLIYMGYVGGMSKSTIIKLHHLIMPEKYFKPDKIVVLTVPEKIQLERIATQARGNEVWKSKGLDFQRKLNRSYKQVIKKYNLPVLDTSGTIEEVFEDLKKLFAI